MLKQLIQRLLDSRTTPAQAGHASKPGSAVPVDYNHSASVDNWGPVLSNSTAVSDGYIWAVGRTTSDKGFFQINTQALQITTTGTSNPGGEILNLFTPVSKGQRFSVYGRYLEQITVRLVKTIGGGQPLKSFILQGGGLCLNSLSSSLRRSSWLARRSGSEVKVFSQTQIPEQRSLLTTLRLSFIRLQVMDGLHSAETDHRSMSALLESWERVALTLKAISELQLRFGRGIPLVSIARRTISNRLKQNSFPAKGQRSTSLVGGASC